MPKFRKRPIVVEAVQWRGDNLSEVQDFCGMRPNSYIQGKNPVFSPIGTYLPAYLNEGTTGELWVQANQSLLPIPTGEWIIKDSLGFYPCQEEKFAETYDPVD